MSVANGEQFLKHDTNTGQVLYLSLEDNLLRLQNRIYDLTDEPCENLNFAIEAQSIGNGLEEELEKSKQELPNLKVIVIDTLQKIRCNTDVNYGSDYKELSVLKALADKLKVAILVVHHTRKCYDSDPFNMVSGSTGIIGSVDGIMVMIEERRGSGKAKLHCAGRDIEHLELNLEFANHRWNVVDDVPERKPDLFSFAMHDLMVDEKRFTGSATELCKLMYKRFGREYAPNWMTRNLVQHTEELKVYGVQFSMRRSHGSRILELIYDQSGDSKNGSLLWVEIADHTGTRDTENIYLPLFEAGDGIHTHKNARICRRHTNRIVIPPATVKAVVAQRRASVAIPHRYYQRRKKTPLTEQYRRRRYEMPASHSAVRRTLAGRGEPRAPS